MPEVLEDVDIKILEDIFEEEHCEVQHDRPGVALWCAPCSHQVVAVLEHSCSGKRGKVCQATIDSAYATKQTVVCRVCRQLVLECWIFIPV